jgi:hypothetical protein
LGGTHEAVPFPIRPALECIFVKNDDNVRWPGFDD